MIGSFPWTTLMLMCRVSGMMACYQKNMQCACIHTRLHGYTHFPASSRLTQSLLPVMKDHSHAQADPSFKCMSFITRLLKITQT